jgi:hypothetical protein
LIPPLWTPTHFNSILWNSSKRVVISMLGRDIRTAISLVMSTRKSLAHLLSRRSTLIIWFKESSLTVLILNWKIKEGFPSQIMQVQARLSSLLIWFTINLKMTTLSPSCLKRLNSRRQTSKILKCRAWDNSKLWPHRMKLKNCLIPQF